MQPWQSNHKLDPIHVDPPTAGNVVRLGAESSYPEDGVWCLENRFVSLWVLFTLSETPGSALHSNHDIYFAVNNIFFQNFLFCL